MHSTPCISFLGYLDKSDKNILFQNLTLLVFLFYILIKKTRCKILFIPLSYKSRVSGRLNLSTFLCQVVKKRNIEKGAPFNGQQKLEVFRKKEKKEKKKKTSWNRSRLQFSKRQF